MASEIKFGTDGWRAIIGDDFTFDNVRVCAQSVAQYLHESGMASRGLIVGYDTRFRVGGLRGGGRGGRRGERHQGLPVRPGDADADG